eukprot:3471619-Amphidinium_carterae.1
MQGYGSPYPGQEGVISHNRVLLEHIRSTTDASQLQAYLTGYPSAFQKDHSIAVGALAKLGALSGWGALNNVECTPFASAVFAFENDLRLFTPDEAWQVLQAFNQLGGQSGREKAFAMRLAQAVSEG